jgi:hypothetical protein
MGTVFFSDANELATVSNVFKVNGVATDPTAVTLTITSPTGVTTTPTPTHTGTGAYSTDVTSNEAGTWQYLWEGTGTASDATAGTWEVQETQLGRLYCTFEALKSRLGITNTDDDFEIYDACFGASRWIETHCERHFWRTASTEVRTFVPDDWYCLKLPEFNDLVSITTLKTDAGGDGTFGTTWTTGQYQLLPLNPTAAPERRPYTQIKALGQTFPVQCGTGIRTDSVQITGAFGWPAVPAAVRTAARIIAAEYYRYKDAPLGAGGQGEFVLPVTNNSERAKAMLAAYRRNAVLVA